MLGRNFSLQKALVVALSLFLIMGAGFVEFVMAAEEEARVVRCDLESCIQLAIANHPALKASEAGVLEAQALVEMSEAVHRPNLALESGVGSLLEDPPSPLPGGYGNRKDEEGTSAGFTFSASSAVPSASDETSVVFERSLLSQDSAKLRQAWYALSQAQWTYRVQRNKVVSEVADLYLKVFQRSEAVKTYEQITTFLDTNFRLARAKFTQGLISRSDLLQEDVRFEKFKKKLTTSRHDLRQSQTQLSSVVLGVGKGNRLEISEILLSSIPLPPMESFVAYARQHHPERMVQEFKTLMSLEKLGVVQSAQYPIRSLFDHDRVTQKGAGKIDTDWMAQFKAHVPLFDFGHLRKEEEAAMAQLEEEKNRLINVTLDVERAIENLYFTITERDDDVAIVKKEIALATEGVKLAQARFQQGLASESEVFMAQVSLLESTLALKQQELDKELAYIQLKLEAGEFSFTDLVTSSHRF